MKGSELHPLDSSGYELRRAIAISKVFALNMKFKEFILVLTKNEYIGILSKTRKMWTFKICDIKNKISKIIKAWYIHKHVREVVLHKHMSMRHKIKLTTLSIYIYTKN